jgi:hypothetical protein
MKDEVRGAQPFDAVVGSRRRPRGKCVSAITAIRTGGSLAAAYGRGISCAARAPTMRIPGASVSAAQVDGSQ